MVKKIGTFDKFRETLDKLNGDGVLLVAGNPPNVMTIGWGTLGIIWNKEILTLYVRPTRYTFGLLENSKDFSVCVMPDTFTKELAFCGSISGADTDKIRKCGFKLEKGITISTPYISGSLYHYECRIVHKHRLDPQTLEPSVITKFYPKKDFHMAYYGEIIGVFEERNE
ncbi:MAG: flavin reductase [Bacteroidota bacterium]|nr:flavin reductase [Bacteroidota bacterium]